MVNTSASGGPLQPAPPPILEGAELEDFFHDLITSLTLLDPTLVRPAWQPEPPNIPQSATVWIAFHLEDKESDAFPWTGPIDDAGLTIGLQRHEEFDVIVSVYGTGAGSQAKAVAKLLRDNLAISQNREPLSAQGMAVIAVDAPQPAPILVKTLWLYRVNMPIRIRRIITRTYPVESLLSAQVDLTIDAESREIDRTTTAIQESP